jgi:hypothetical protein
MSRMDHDPVTVGRGRALKALQANPKKEKALRGGPWGYRAIKLMAGSVSTDHFWKAATERLSPLRL